LRAAPGESMFDIAFSELVVIGVVALVVIGPERLPKVARTMGHIFGRLQRYVAQVKSDINREIELSELSKVKTEFEGAAREFQRDIESKVHEAESDIREVETEIDRQLRSDGQAASPLPAPDAAAPAAAAPVESPSPGAAQLELAIDGPASPPAQPPKPGAA
jgi:sec-independent protein translocase protein TatB